MKCDVEIKDFNIKNCYSVQCVPPELGTHNDMTAPPETTKTARLLAVFAL